MTVSAPSTAAHLNFTHPADSCVAVPSPMQHPMPGFLLWGPVLTTTAEVYLACTGILKVPPILQVSSLTQAMTPTLVSAM